MSGSGAVLDRIWPALSYVAVRSTTVDIGPRGVSHVPAIQISQSGPNRAISRNRCLEGTPHPSAEQPESSSLGYQARGLQPALVAKGKGGVSRVLRVVTAFVAAVALSALFLATRPNVIVVAPWPPAPMRLAPVVTTAELLSGQIEKAVISSITRSELPARRIGFGEPELE